MLTQQRLKEVLEYDPLTGVFTRQRAEIAGSPPQKNWVITRITENVHEQH